MNAPIVEKIRKLLATAERGGSEAEMASAMGHAMRLLAAHGLGMADVAPAAPETVEVIRIAGQTESMTWRNHIWNAVCPLYFCHYIRSGREHIVVGRPSHVAVARATCEHLIRVCDMLAGREPGDSRSSYRTGFVHRVYARTREEIARAKAGPVTDATGTALIIHPLYSATDRENRAVVARLGATTRCRRQPCVRDSAAFARGQDAAEGVALRGDLID